MIEEVELLGLYVEKGRLKPNAVPCSAPVRYFYVVSFTGIIDLLSILPIFWVFQ
jgi:hypothetical protein